MGAQMQDLKCLKIQHVLMNGKRETLRCRPRVGGDCDGESGGKNTAAETNFTASLPIVPWPVPLSYFGVKWYRPPGLASSSIQSEPSGASSISRTRLPMFQRCAAVAPPLPSNVTRTSAMEPKPLIKASPFHGKTVPW